MNKCDAKGASDSSGYPIYNKDCYCEWCTFYKKPLHEHVWETKRTAGVKLEVSKSCWEQLKEENEKLKAENEKLKISNRDTSYENWKNEMDFMAIKDNLERQISNLKAENAKLKKTLDRELYEDDGIVDVILRDQYKADAEIRQLKAQLQQSRDKELENIKQSVKDAAPLFDKPVGENAERLSKMLDGMQKPQPKPECQLCQDGQYNMNCPDCRAAQPKYFKDGCTLCALRTIIES